MSSLKTLIEPGFGKKKGSQELKKTLLEERISEYVHWLPFETGQIWPMRLIRVYHVTEQPKDHD
ncbi:MAG: hypothetical protein D6B25_14795 [Desulfobulbaceae bacterium]|nr:MAG: hypothetical protein D6B25_14795 [Desulfobulbaceae bacterium]